jgi:hypothetical protein
LFCAKVGDDIAAATHTIASAANLKIPINILHCVREALSCSQLRRVSLFGNARRPMALSLCEKMKRIRHVLWQLE